MTTRKLLTLILILPFVMNNNILAQDADTYLKELTTGKWRAKSPVNVVSMNDGERFAYIGNDRKQIIVDYYKTSKPQVLFDIDKHEKCPFSKIDNFSFDQRESKILIETNGRPIYRRSVIADYYVYDIDRNKISQLSDGGSQQAALFSPNGRIIAFTRDNNLFLKKLDFGTESRITKDGKAGKIINGIADWVYEEEFAQVRYFTFSPDNKLLAYIKFDEKEVSEFSIQIFNDNYPTLENFKYPKAGTTNSKVSVWVYDIENRTTTKMQVEGEDFYIPYIKWTNSADALSIVKLSRDQKNIELLSINPRSGLSTKLYAEKSKTYSDYRNFNVRFNADNSFVMMSEKDGYRHIYLYSPTGIQIQQLTKGKFDVTAFYGYDEAKKTVYCQAAFNSPTEREVYKVANNKMTPLDKRKGYHSALFSNGFKYAIHSYSDINTPNIYNVVDNSGKIVRNIENNSDLSDKYRKQSGIPQKKFFSFTTSEGITLNGWIIEPRNLPKDGNRRIVMTQYSGPDSQEAINQWDMDWEYYLAMNGFVVACVDGRGTGSRGTEFRNCTYGKLGILEAQDQIAAAQYLKQQYPNSKIGIWGWSYGGFMTLQCLTTEGSPFAAGVAIAPVTDWRLYNTAYTERFMNRPQENIDGYDLTSVLNRADRLQGSLLMIHGTADDNVHIQNTYLMADKLVEAGKIFDMQIFTNKNHSILGSKSRYNIYRRCMEFFYDKLK